MVLYCVYTQYTTSIKNTLRCLLDLCFPYISLIIASELKVLHCKHRQCKHQHFSVLLLKLSATVFPPTQTINCWIGTYLSVATFCRWGFFFFCFLLFFCSPILIACEELRLSCRSPSSLARRASWLIIITTSLRCLVQLGQTRQRKRWPLFFVLLDIKLSASAKSDE